MFKVMDKMVVKVGNGNHNGSGKTAHDTTQFHICPVVLGLVLTINPPSCCSVTPKWRRLLNPPHFFLLLLLPPTSTSKISLSLTPFIPLLEKLNLFVFRVLPLPIPPSATTTAATQTLIFPNCAFLGTWTEA